MPEDVVSGYTTVEEDGVTKYKAGQLLFFLLGGPVFPRNTNFRGDHRAPSTPHEQVTHKTPDIVPVFKYAAQPETRKRANLSYENKTIQNAPVLSEITRLRDEAAKLLGYKNHAEWVLEVRRGSVEHTGPFCRPLVRWNAR